MYANALPWDEQADRKLLDEAADNLDNIKTVVTPVHKMYAKVAKLALNRSKKVMVLDKTGSGSVLFYDVSEADGERAMLDQSHEEVIVCELLTNVTDFAVTAIDNKVYVSGGFDLNDEAPINALIVFDGYTGEWRLLAGMTKNRCNHTMVQWKDGILVTGGVGNAAQSLTSTCELYNPQTDKWTMLESLPEPRSCHACVVHKDKLFVTGGLGNSLHPQTNIWVYEQTTSRWLTLDEDYPLLLPCGLAKHSMVSHYDSIYIIGGVIKKATDHGHALKPTARIISFKPQVSYLGAGSLCEDIQKTKYDRVTPWSHDHKLLPEPLYNSAILKLGHRIIIMGGSRDGGRNSNFIAYNMQHNTMETYKCLSRKYARGLPLSSTATTVERTSRQALEQFVPRNWPLW